MWHALRRAFSVSRGSTDGRYSRRPTQEHSGHRDWFDAAPAPTDDAFSVASNPSVSSYDSSSRHRQHVAIAMQYFGPTSLVTRCSDRDGEDQNRGVAPDEDIQRRNETPAQRLVRKENERTFADLVHLVNTKQPVRLDAFKRRLPKSHESVEEEDHISSYTSDTKFDTDAANRQLNTELIEAYVAYARSIGREPAIEVDIGERLSDEEENEEDPLAAERRRYVQERKRLAEQQHAWTPWIGTRYSRRRGCIQFWLFVLVGLVITTVMVVFLSTIGLNEVLHLDAFVGSEVAITSDHAYMHLRDEVAFSLEYDIEAADPAAQFSVLLLNEDNYARYTSGEPFESIGAASQYRVAHRARLSPTHIDNTGHDEMFLVVQPCMLRLVDYCQNRSQLPTASASRQRIFTLPPLTDTGFAIARFTINPMPDACAASGVKGAAYLLIFGPYIIACLFGLRVVQMLLHCESFRRNLERTYTHEDAIPEAEVDYWQPTPWDRKVPKTRLLGPCCWRKMRRPFEPFYTWWRHENYFTWVFFPYRNERLSRGERAIIIFCSLYVTFYVTFILAMLRGAGDVPVLGDSVVVYWLALLLLPTLGKAVFKEMFKLVFRQRRKFFRLRAQGGDTGHFSFRLAFLAQLLVVLFITLAQAPLLYIWLNRSCAFLKEFVYFALLAACARLSLLGLVLDGVWYLVLRGCGWRDLCPHCTERIVHCDCFNDELLVLGVTRVGRKWELLLLLDRVLSRHAGYDPQFDGYTPEQLHERWTVLVARAAAVLDRVAKLRAVGLAHAAAIDCKRERRIAALERRLQQSQEDDAHYDSTIVGIFHSMRRAVATAADTTDDVVLASPAERLARREAEHERRDRAFSVLDGCRVEKVERRRRSSAGLADLEATLLSSAHPEAETEAYRVAERSLSLSSLLWTNTTAFVQWLLKYDRSQY